MKYFIFQVTFRNEFTGNCHKVDLKAHTESKLIKQFKVNYRNCTILEIYKFFNEAQKIKLDVSKINSKK